MILAFVFMGVAIVLLCRLLFTLTVHAMPLGVAVGIGFAAHTAGAGMTAAILLAFASFVMTLAAVQMALGVSGPKVQLMIAAAFAAPAMFAGYHLVHGAAALIFPSELARHILASLGGIGIGNAAWLRLATAGRATQG